MNRLLLIVLFPFTVWAQQGVHVEMKITQTKGMGGSLHLYADTLGKRMEYRIGSGQKDEKRHIISLLRTDMPDTIFWMHEPSNCFSAAPRDHAILPDKVKYKVEILGDTVISGYACKHVQVLGVKSAYEFWNTTQIDGRKFIEIMATDRRWLTTERMEAVTLAGAGGFPVKMLQRSPMEGETTIELVKIEKKKLDKKLFEAPATYSRMSPIASEAPKSNQYPARDTIRSMPGKNSK